MKRRSLLALGAAIFLLIPPLNVRADETISEWDQEISQDTSGSAAVSQEAETRENSEENLSGSSAEKEDPAETEENSIPESDIPVPLEYEEGWITRNGHTLWQNTDGSCVKAAWKTIEGASYYFDANGYRVTGWLKLSDGWYYLDEQGKKVSSCWIDTYYLDASGRWDTTVTWHPQGWQKDRIGWWWQNTDGSYPRNTFQTIDGVSYYFNNSGYMATGWQLLGNSWYYFHTSGRMLTGWQYLNGSWYYLNNDGKMATGWKQLKGVWYYLNSSGRMLTGWQYLGGSWYYLDASGRMLTGWQYLGGSWYYLDASGRMLTGWQYLGGSWYYLNASGRMLTGWQYLGSHWFYLNSSGRMLTGWQHLGSHWFYMNSSGYMLTGWQKIDDTWYYLNSSGYMLTGWQYLGGSWYYLNSSGAMAVGWLQSGGATYYLESSGAMCCNTWKSLSDKWYYFTESGAMAVNTWIGSYYVDEDGVWDADKEAPDYVWPCPGSTIISSDYGYRVSPTAGASSNHQGIDIAANYGEKIVSFSAGTVIAYGYNSSMGNYVKIRHNSQLTSVYMHMSSFSASMRTGKTVSAGETIGYVGATGVATGPHLHFGVMVNGSYVSPWNYLSRP